MIDILPYHSRLQESPLLSDMEESEVRTMFDCMEHLCYEAGSQIVKQGSDDKGLWLVGDGCCEVVRSNLAGTKEQVLAMLGPGTVFGEMSFFQKEVHSVSIRSVTPVSVHKLTPEAFADLRASDCQIAGKILTNLVRVQADRLHMMDQWVCELLDKTQQPRHSNGSKLEEWRDFRAKLYSDWNFQ